MKLKSELDGVAFDLRSNATIISLTNITMADQQQPLKAPFPPPPPFYKSFTTANLAQLRKLRKESSATSEAADISILNLPLELRYLIPPQPPADGTWTSYGSTLTNRDEQISLADSGIEQLYPSSEDAKINPQPRLIALARSLLTTFLSLVGILSRDPTLYAGRVEDLQTICYNMHDLINQYRPHQARETLILMMEERVQKLREEIARVREGRERVGELMQGLTGGEDKIGEVMQRPGERVGEKEGEDGTDRRRQKQRGAWAAIEG
jgi:mediator of RNA polymerase II transcription subunit 7